MSTRSGKLKLVLFDLDGTLADTAPDLVAAVHDAFLESGQPAPDPDLARAQISHGGRAMISAALPAPLTEAHFESLLERFLSLYRQQIAERTSLFAGMAPVLEHLERAGIRWGIVTNKRANLTEPLVDALGLRERIACVISGDSAARAKPSPDPLLLALEQTGCSSAESLYVGDARNDVVAARAAGMAVVVANYGYIADGEDPTGWRADGYINTPVDLLDWLDNR